MRQVNGTDAGDSDDEIRASFLIQQYGFHTFETRKGFVLEGLENFQDRKQDSQFYLLRSGKQAGTVDMFVLNSEIERRFKVCFHCQTEIGNLFARRRDVGSKLKAVQFENNQGRFQVVLEDDPKIAFGAFDGEGQKMSSTIVGHYELCHEDDQSIHLKLVSSKIEVKIISEDQKFKPLSKIESSKIDQKELSRLMLYFHEYGVCDEDCEINRKRENRHGIQVIEDECDIKARMIETGFFSKKHEIQLKSTNQGLILESIQSFALTSKEDSAKFSFMKVKGTQIEMQFSFIETLDWIDQERNFSKNLFQQALSQEESFNQLKEKKLVFEHIFIFRLLHGSKKVMQVFKDEGILQQIEERHNIVLITERLYHCHVRITKSSEIISSLIFPGCVALFR